MLETRQSWDDTWMRVAKTIGERSICDRRRVGAVVVTSTNRPVAVGYNGPPAGYGVPGRCSRWCERQVKATRDKGYGDCPTVHAEMNALLFADRRDFEGGTLYVTSSLCWDCGKVVANSGIATVVMEIDREADAHRDPEKTISFLESCGLDVIVFNERES